MLIFKTSPDVMCIILMIENNEVDIRLTKEALNSGIIPIKISLARYEPESIKYLVAQLHNANPDLPDLILLDINLPKKSGHDLLKPINKHNMLKKYLW